MNAAEYFIAESDRPLMDRMLSRDCVRRGGNYPETGGQRLEEILSKFGESWEQLALALQEFVEHVTRGRKRDESVPGLDPQVHAPFFDILKEERSKTSPMGQKDQQWLADLTLDMVDRLIRDEVTNVGFWKSPTRQEDLRGKLFVFLDDNNIIDFDRADAVADRLMDLAKANHTKLARGE